MIVTTNLFGDILSDEASMLVGGLGLACSGNIGEGAAVFEPVHGSAPKLVGHGQGQPAGDAALGGHDAGVFGRGRTGRAAARGGGAGDCNRAGDARLGRHACAPSEVADAVIQVIGGNGMMRVGFLYTRVRVEEKLCCRSSPNAPDVEVVQISDEDAFFDIDQLARRRGCAL